MTSLKIKQLGTLDKSINLIVIKPEYTIEFSADILKALKKAHFSGIYITSNKTYAYLVEFLYKKKVDTNEIYFIDLVTTVFADNPVKANNCLFMLSPQELTELTIALDTAVNSVNSLGPTFLLLDSISTLLIYNKSETIIRFIHILINKLRNFKITAFLIFLKKEGDEKMISQLSEFCDEVINVRGDSLK